MGQWNGNVYNGDATNENVAGSGAGETLLGAAGNDTLSGGGGDDIVNGGSGANLLNGNEGNDQLIFAFDFLADTVIGGSGADTFAARYTGDGSVRVIQTPRTFSTAVTLDGRMVADISHVEAFNIQTGAGRDSIAGLNGGDTIDAGLGANTVSGGGGNDVFVMRLDTLLDNVKGGGGNDDRLQILGQGARAVVVDLVGPGLIDVRVGGVKALDASGVESIDIQGSSAADTLEGLAGIDNIFGNRGNDFIHGQSGNDNLLGGLGNDTILGGLGNDVIEGDAGNDSLSGLNGADKFTFVSAVGQGIDRIVDFNTVDRIVVRASGFAGLVAGGPVDLIKGANPHVVAGSTDPVFLFNTSSGLLSFDPDGAGRLAASVFADVHRGSGVPVATALTEGQFLVI